MKKLGFIICLIFAFVVPFFGGNSFSGVLAEPEVYIQVSAISQLDREHINPNGRYILTQDIDASGAFIPADLFSGILDGNGQKIKNR